MNKVDKFGNYEDLSIDSDLSIDVNSNNGEWSLSPDVSDLNYDGGVFESSGLWKNLRLIIIMFAVVLSYRTIDLQLIKGSKLNAEALGNRLRVEIIRPPRGLIYDANGEVLAINQPSYTLLLRNNLVTDVELLEQRLKEIDVILDEEIFEKYNDNIDEFLIILATDIPADKAIQLQSEYSDLDDLVIEHSITRKYLDDTTLSHILGYSSKITKEELDVNPEYDLNATIGKVGIEKTYEQELKGEVGYRQVEVDSTSKAKKLLAQTSPKNGKSLHLTVDLDLQKKGYQILEDNILKNGATKGSLIAMDPDTGDIKTIISYPSYDLNVFTGKVDPEEYSEIVSNTDNPLFNRAVEGSYPIGSIVKPIVAIAGLEEGVINSNTAYVDNGSLTIQDKYNSDVQYVFKGWKPEGLGTVDVVRSLAMSSDIFYYIAGGGYEDKYGLGPSKLVTWMKKFGLGEKTGIDLNFEASGYTPPSSLTSDTSKWFLGDTYSLSIGQGKLLSSPLQILNATAAVVNGGKLVSPKLVSKITEFQSNEDHRYIDSYSTNLGIDPYSIELVKRGMLEVVNGNGTAGNAFIDKPYSLLGKSGTAETQTEVEGEERSKAHAWFTAATPSDNPQLVLVSMIEFGGQGSVAAMPVIEEFLDYYWSRD